MATGLRATITPQEARRAIYLDYEGNKSRDPVLMGWMTEGAIFGAIVDPAFAECAHRYRARHVGVADHLELATELLGQAASEHRKIISWSEHDFRVLCGLLDPHGVQRLGRVYRNAIPTARRWYCHAQGEGVGEASLAHYMDMLGYRVPEQYGQGVVGKALRNIRSQLSSGKRYGQLTSGARTGWQAVVKHNMHDLQAMALVVTEASRALEQSGS